MADHALATITNPSSALTDFTLIVDLENMPSSWWSAVTSSDGTKGRVYKGDGTTRLACDWIDFDNTAETGILRVLWSGTLASSGTQQLWIEPPVSGNDSVAVDDTYGQYNAYDDNWAIYLPMDGDLNDRTSNGNNGTANGDATTTTGIMGGGYTFYGANDWIDCGTSPAGGESAITVMAFVKPSTTANYMISEDGTLYNTNGFYFSTDSNGYPEVEIYANSNYNLCNWGSAIPTDDYSHMALSWASGSAIKLLVDGVSGGTTSGSTRTGVLQTGDKPLIIGGRPASTYPNSPWINIDYNGDVDEYQIHLTNRSDDWIAEEYAQTSDNSTFWGTWTWSAGGGGETSIPVIMHHYAMMRK